METTTNPGYIYVAHENGTKTFVSLQDGGELLIRNNVADDGVELLPQQLGTVDPAETLTSFMQIVMRTADLASGLLDNQPRNAKLKRLYPVGREKRIDPKTRQKHLGSTAVSREISTRPIEDISETELGLEILDDRVRLTDIGGLQHVKDMLSDIVISFKHPDVMTKWGASRPRGVLLYGEPGTGKTMLAQALANELGADMWSIQSTDVYEMWLGNSEDRIKQIFEKAKKAKKPLVIFFDEFESVMGIADNPSPGGADHARNAVAGIFKQEMNTLTEVNPNVLVVAATNDLDKIDPSLMRSGRFDFKIYVPMPDIEARQQIVSAIVSKSMLSNESGEFKVFADDLDVPEIADLTDGMSGADISEIFRRLSLEKAMQEARTNRPQEPITQAEIRQALLDFRQLG